MTHKRIGILTGGGDVPGLNSVIKRVVLCGAEHRCEVIGIRRGWEGLTHLNLEDPASKARYVRPLSVEATRNIDRTGGTFLHSSRTNPARMKSVPAFLADRSGPAAEPAKPGATSATADLTPQVMSNLERLRLDCLIAVGGDDTLGYAAHLDKLGVKIVAVPKTMDNDVRNTEYCIGFSTAITRAFDAIERQRTTVGSHERIGLFRLFGRNAGYTALYTAYVTSIRCGIPEHKFDLGTLIDLLLRDKRTNPSNYCLFAMSESAEWEGYHLREHGEADPYGHRKKVNVAEDLSEAIKKKTGEETLVSDLTYELRSGDPDFTDRLVSATFGTMAFEAVWAGKSGLMTAIVDGCYHLVDIPDPKLGPRHVDIDSMYDTAELRPNYANRLGWPMFLTRT
jgi:ATP-dependent phosphofructokinase / diphosphate-dependent phosphofructokinase